MVDTEEEDFEDLDITPVNLEPLDIKIIEALQKDGTLSLRKLSEITGSSITAIKNHLDHLKREGILKRTTAIVDCCKIGFNNMLIFSLRVRANVPILEISKKLNKIPNINAIYQISGAYPILCIAKCVSKQNQIELIEQVKNVDGVEEVITQVVLRKIKEDFRVKIRYKDIN
ncbi:MAG: Lrp/AsnC family transcriptional regulator [Promethearchaeota archaeon]